MNLTKTFRYSLAVLALTLIAIPWGLRAEDSTDASTEASTGTSTGTFDLETFSELSEAFNEHDGTVRLVALLSPSCGYCVKGYRYMRKLLEEIDDPRLTMLVAWEPMLSGDTRALAFKMAKKETDPRMVYQVWDQERVTGDSYTEVLLAQDERWRAGDSTAWDVYFLYEGEVAWDGDRPTVPSYWQHQGAGQSEDALNYTKLKEEIEKRLTELPDQTASVLPSN